MPRFTDLTRYARFLSWDVIEGIVDLEVGMEATFSFESIEHPPTRRARLTLRIESDDIRRVKVMHEHVLRVQAVSGALTAATAPEYRDEGAVGQLCATYVPA